MEKSEWLYLVSVVFVWMLDDTRPTKQDAVLWEYMFSFLKSFKLKYSQDFCKLRFFQVGHIYSNIFIAGEHFQ